MLHPQPVRPAVALGLSALLLFGAADSSAAATLWLSTKGPTSATGQSPTSWSTNHVVSFRGPGLAYGPNATVGTFKVEFGFQPPQPIREIYFVSTTNRIGNPGTDFELWPGDLLVVLNVTTPTTIGGVTNVLRDDVLLYRPGPGRDYTNGTFSMLLENPIFATTTRNVHALTLVERDTMLGNKLISKGTFLVARSDPALDMNVYTYRPAGVGRGATTASAGTLLLAGSKLGISGMIQGLDLIESPLTLGTTNLAAGLLLVSVDDPDTLNPGTQNLAFQPQDIFILDVTATEQDTTPDTVATAAILFDGSNVGLDAGDADENLIAFTLIDSVTRAPFLSALSGNRWAAVGENVNLSVTASGDVPLTYQWFRNGTPVNGATNATFSLVNLQLSDSGDYTVHVGNAYGSILSPPITLSVAVGGAVITVTTTNDSGAGSLRQAILNAASIQGTKTIQFNIPTSSVGALTINLLSALPGLTNDVTIDGYTQPGASRNTLTNGNNAVIKIRLSGTAASGASGLRISNPGCAVYGLAIGNFAADGIYLFSSGNAIIQGNFIGLDPDGVTVRTNTGTGVRSTAAGAVIGGTLPWQRNIISGNLGGGIQVQNSPTNVIQGNYLGTDASGTLARGNGGFAVQLTTPNSTGNVIGGEWPGEGNVIAATTGTGSNGHGIHLVNASNIRVQGNFIGTDATGLNPLGNLGYGIYLTNATINNLIGGTNDSARNVIAYNARAGIHIASGTNGVLGNSIFANGGLGIDLGKVGVQTNDFTDADVGPNNLQNYPVLNSATNLPGVLQITGYLRSRTNFTYRLEFFTSPVADTSTNGEGKNFLGFTNISLTTTSLANFTVSFPTIPGGDPVVTATATDPANNTSEFSSWRTITYKDLVLVEGTPQSQTVAPGADATFSVTARGTAPISYQWFRDGAPFNGATAATLVINAAQQGDSGIYHVVASNLYGGVTSAPVALNLLPVSGTLAVTNLNDGGVGSFRQALLNANANPGPHTINFSLPGAGPFKINITSPLPEIANPVTIDGTTQPGFSNRPVVEVNGRNSTGDGLFITAGGCTIKGLAINEFPGHGLVLALGPSNVVKGNFIGTGVNGSTDLPNGHHGLIISNSAWNVLGGTTALTRNVVIDSGLDCIHITGTEANHNSVLGNILGMDWTGLVKVGGQRHGLVVSNASWNIIGGTNNGAGNLSSYHRGDSLIIGGSNAAFNRVEGNLFGTDITGTNAVGGSGNGISIWDAPSNTVGGLTLAAANVIADQSRNGIELGGSAAEFNVVQGNFIVKNKDAGVRSSSVSNNLVGGLEPGAVNWIFWNEGEGVLVDGGQCAIMGNSIYSNNGDAISLLNGGNNFPIRPALTAATNSAGATRVLGRLTSTPSTTFRIELFASPTSAGDGKNFLAAIALATDASGLGTFNVLLATGNILGQFATATATDPFGNTSEFSSARTIVNGLFSAEMAAAYEGFDYPAGTLPGAAGGTGWTGPWADQAGFSGSGLVLGGTLNDPTATLPRSGNHGGLSGARADAAALRNLGTPLGTDGTTAWISFLLRPDGAVGSGKYGGLALGGTAGTGANGLFIGHTSGGYRVERIGTGTGPVVGGIVPVQGITAFVVARLEFLAGNDRATVYLNPTPGLTTPDSSSTATFTNLDLGSFTQIKIAGGGGAQQSVDEIRLGPSYESVAPWGAPVLITQPQGQSVVAGMTAQLAVAAAGTTPLHHQWYRNGVMIPGGIDGTLVLTNAQFAQSGDYTVTVTNLFGTATSQVAVVSVTAGLPDGLVHWWAGDSNALDYAGTNHGTLWNGATYRAGKVGSALACDGTNDAVDVGPMPWLGTATGMTVMAWIHRTNVVNRFGGVLGRWQSTGASNSAAATSNTFLLACGEGTVSNRVRWVLQFTNLNSYSVAGATVLPTNQWTHVAATWNSADGLATVYLNGVTDGATNFPPGQRLQFLPGYTTKIGTWGNSTNSARQFQGGIDEVIVIGRPLSSNEIQTVHAAGGAGLAKAPVITTQPADIVAGAGSNVKFSVVAMGASPLSHQWRRDGVILPDATNTSLTIASAQSADVASYSVVISNLVGTATSADANLILAVPPSITGQPRSRTVPLAGSTSFTVELTPPGPFTFQWWRDGSPLPGTDNPILTVFGAQFSDAGGYSVSISNAAGAVTSVVATLSVVVPPPSSLAHWWPGDSNALDYAGGNHGVLSNGATFATGQIGPAFSLDGTNDFIDVGQISSLHTATGFTVMAWVRKRDLANPLGAIVGRWDTYPLTRTNTFLLYNGEGSATNRGALVLCFTDHTGGTLPGKTIIPTNQWVHLAATWRSSDGLAMLYKNGVPESSNTFGAGKTLKAPAGYSAKIGEWGVVRTSAYKFSGQIDDVALVTRALTAAEIATHYAAGSAGGGIDRGPALLTQPEPQHAPLGSDVTLRVGAAGGPPMTYQWQHAGTNVPGGTGPTLLLPELKVAALGSYSVAVSNAYNTVFSQVVPVDATYPTLNGLLGWWPGDGHARDCAGTNSGTLLNGATFASGAVGQAFHLDGVNDYLDLGELPALQDLAELTVSAWIFKTNNFGPGGIVGHWDGYPLTRNNSFLLYNGDSGFADKGGFLLCFNDSTGFTLAGRTLIPTNQWIHLVATWRNSDGYTALYKNGVLDNVTYNGVGKRLKYQPGYGVKIGEWGIVRTGAYKFQGGIDEVGLWGRALAPSDVLKDFSASGQVPGLAPVIVVPPTGGTVLTQTNFTFSVGVAGSWPLTYQWFADGTPLASATNSQFTLAPVQLSDAAGYSVRVSNAYGVALSSAATLVVLAPTVPAITSQPQGHWVPAGTNVALSVGFSGTGPFRIQWRLNGVNIPGRTNATLAFTNVQVANSGSYAVVVSTPAGAVDSTTAILTVPAPSLAFTDDLAAPAPLTAPSGSGRASNALATIQAGEPRHAGKPGDRSVWLAWQAPDNGIVTLSTAGSAFDTLLAVYTGATLPSLVEVASDDDDGGYHNSLVRFNAVAGVIYQIAVAGFADSRGDVVVSWSLETTFEAIPRIVTQPSDQTVPMGSNAVFSVAASGVGLTYQWFFNSLPIGGATGTNLPLTGVSEAGVGRYSVRVANATRTVTSHPGALELIFPDTNGPPTDPPGRSANKFFDAAERALVP